MVAQVVADVVPVGQVGQNGQHGLVEALLAGVLGRVVVGAQHELEVAVVVRRHVHDHLDLLAGPVLAGDDAVREGAAGGLVLARLGVPGVAADAALAAQGLLVLYGN